MYIVHYITGVVLLIHASLIGWVVWNTATPVASRPPPHQFVIQTVQLKKETAKKFEAPFSKPSSPPLLTASIDAQKKPAKNLDKTKTETKIKKKPEIKKVVKKPQPKAPVPKVPEPKAPVPKVPEPKAPEPKTPEPKVPVKSQPTSKKENNSNMKKLLAAAEEKLKRLDFEKTKSESRISSVNHTESAATKEKETLQESAEFSYQDAVASRLKQFLRLPESGDVRISLTINRSGKCEDVSVISAKSAKNREYIIKSVKTVQFPPFGSCFIGESSHTFSVTITSEQY